MMFVQDMHYDFKSKLAKIDSEQYRNFRIPEVDRLLNEAVQVYINKYIMSHMNPTAAFEVNQKVLDRVDILVTETAIVPSPANVFPLPSDYWYFVRGRLRAKKGDCKDDGIVLYIVKHGDVNEKSYRTSSYLWREAVGYFINDALKVVPGDMELIGLKLTYLKKHPYIHYAEGYSNTGYKLPSGIQLTGVQDCLFPEDLCKDIVDIAVMLARYGLKNTLDINMSINQLKLKDHEL